jgi:hypothetical protein
MHLLGEGPRIDRNRSPGRYCVALDRTSAIRSAMREICYSILHDVVPVGKVLGTYGGRPFYEAVRDEFGRLYLFVGIASKTPTGGFDPEALGRGEFIVKRGLLYRFVDTREKSRKRTD